MSLGYEVIWIWIAFKDIFWQNSVDLCDKKYFRFKKSALAMYVLHLKQYQQIFYQY